jgi:hypothetical protein
VEFCNQTFSKACSVLGILLFRIINSDSGEKPMQELVHRYNISDRYNLVRRSI